jgi:hypothetical protein
MIMTRRIRIRKRKKAKEGYGHPLPRSSIPALNKALISIYDPPSAGQLSAKTRAEAGGMSK